MGDLVENLDEICSSWDISPFEDCDGKLSSVSESYDESSSLSLSDSSENELYSLFLDPLSFFLGESCLLFFWTLLLHLLFKVLSSSNVSDGIFSTWLISGSSSVITMENKRNHLPD